MNRCVNSITGDTSSRINWNLFASFLRTKSLACFLLGDVVVHHVRHISQWIAVKMFCFSVHHIELSLHLLHCERFVFDSSLDPQRCSSQVTYVPARTMVRSAAAPARRPSLVPVNRVAIHSKHIVIKLFCTNWYNQSRTRCQLCVDSGPRRPAARLCDRARRSVSRPSSLAGVPSATVLFFTVHKIAARCHGASCGVVNQLMPLRAFATHYFGSLSVAKKTKSHARGPMR